MIVPALTRGGYDYKKQQIIGIRPGGGRHLVDFIAQKTGEKPILISAKWQQVDGTAEQKVPFEVISLIQAIRASGVTYEKAYLILGGGGWKRRSFFVEGGLDEYIIGSELVRILTLEDFVALANQGRL